MRKLILLFLAIIMLVGYLMSYKENYYVIPNEAIRIRIVPNSNSAKDQLIKKEVKTNVELDLESDLKKSKTIEESRNIIKSNLPTYRKTVENILNRENNPYNYRISYGFNHFPEKEYKGVKYKEGEYESLLITLGKGEGDNWWCVLFPPICSLEVEDNNTSEIEYTSYIKEIFTKFSK